MAARSEWRILLALWLMVFSASSQVVIMAPILPRIGATLGIGELEQGSLITAYAVMLSVMALVVGPVSDRLGRRLILLAGSG
ncbi:MFS transporter, partial [Rhodothermus marinus]|uniref:MFS transporter n=1 Tax=Rhodothermus marinus TaxID=29549 RepID=UPI000B2444B3